MQGRLCPLTSAIEFTMSKTLPFANLKVPVPGFGSVRVQPSLRTVSQRYEALHTELTVIAA